MTDLLTMIERMAIEQDRATALRRLAMYPPIKAVDWGFTNDDVAYERRKAEINEKYDRMVADLQADTIDIPCEVVEDQPKQLGP